MTDYPEDPAPGPVRAATELSIAQAYVDKVLGPLDAGAVSALRVLADKIDKDDELRERYLDLTANEDGSPVKPLQLDNVSLPTYLKYCDALGLTPAGRAAQAGKAPAKERTSGKLANLRSVPRPAAGA